MPLWIILHTDILTHFATSLPLLRLALIRGLCHADLVDIPVNTTVRTHSGERSESPSSPDSMSMPPSLCGGGVLYFPAGDYHFSDHLKLKSGVVIRGATPAVADARKNAYAPPATVSSTLTCSAR